MGLQRNWFPPESGLVTHEALTHIEGVLPKGPYLPCVSMADRALLAGYHRHMHCSELSQHRFREQFVAWLAPSHYLTQCWLTLIWTHWNKQVKSKYTHFDSSQCIWKYGLQNISHLFWTVHPSHAGWTEWSPQSIKTISKIRTVKICCGKCKDFHGLIVVMFYVLND